MTRITYQINEIFDSVQGEGYWTGVAATFIRLQGCTVGCPWCDSGPMADEIFARRSNGLTRNTWGKGGERMELLKIIDQVNHDHVVITGGEPTLYDLDPLIGMLTSVGCYTQLETSGQNELKGCLQPNWVTWSPKPLLQFNAPDTIKMLADEVKFVIDQGTDSGPVLSIWSWMLKHRLTCLPWFILMPEGCPPSQEMVDKTLGIIGQSDFKHHKWRFGDRLQYRLHVR